MKNKQTWKRLITTCLLFSILFTVFLSQSMVFAETTVTSDGDEDSGGWFNEWFSGIVSELKDALVNKLYEKVLEWITKPMVSLGDSILHMIIRCVGENVTVDRLIFGDVNKVSIDYWGSGTSNSVKAFLKPVVQKWYAVFFKIAMIVYMIVLVYIGDFASEHC